MTCLRGHDILWGQACYKEDVYSVHAVALQNTAAFVATNLN